MKRYFIVDPNSTPDGFTFSVIVLQIDESSAKLVYVLPELATPEEATTRATLFYPEALLVENYSALYKLWTAEGWIKPGLQCNTFCADCGARLYIHNEWKWAGRDAPYGSLVHQFCYCPGCQRQYCYSWQVRQHGIERWWTRQVDDTWPDDAIVLKTSEEVGLYGDTNPYGFRWVEMKRNSEQK